MQVGIADSGDRGGTLKASPAVFLQELSSNICSQEELNFASVSVRVEEKCK